MNLVKNSSKREIVFSDNGAWRFVLIHTYCMCSLFLEKSMVFKGVLAENMGKKGKIKENMGKHGKTCKSASHL
jgi:hypothetical protein